MHIGKHIVRVGWLGLHAALWAVPVLNITYYSTYYSTYYTSSIEIRCTNEMVLLVLLDVTYQLDLITGRVNVLPVGIYPRMLHLMQHADILMWRGLLSATSTSLSLCFFSVFLLCVSLL